MTTCSQNTLKASSIQAVSAHGSTNMFTVFVRLLSQTQLLAARAYKPDLPNLITDKIPTTTWFFLPSIMCFPCIYLLLVLPLQPLRSACDRLVNISEDISGSNFKLTCLRMLS